MRRFLSFAIVIVLVISLFSANAFASEVTMKTIGGQPDEKMKVEVYSNGDMQVYVDLGEGLEYQYFGTDSWGSVLTYGEESFSSSAYGGSPISTSNWVTTDYSASIKWKTADENLEITQTVSFSPGARLLKKQWQIKNVSSPAATISNLKFAHGGDSYFDGKDLGQGYYDLETKQMYMHNSGDHATVYVYGDTSTPQSHYYEDIQDLVKAAVIATNLPDTTNPGSEDPDNAVDAGYALQWDKLNITSGETWNIIMYEDFKTAEEVISAAADSTSTSNSKTPSKRAPVTISTGAKGSSQTNDLSLLVAIPEQWMDTTSQVEFWLDSEAVTAKTVVGETNYAYLAPAKAILKSIGSTLLSTSQVDLMQRVTKKDGTITGAKVAQEHIRGNFTIRLPIPENLLNAKNLGIVYIEDTGLTANLASKIVVIDGVSYIEFENNRSAVYGFVSDKNNAATK